MDLALSEDGFVTSPTRKMAESLRVFSSGFLLQTSGLQSRDLSIEAAGSEFAGQLLLGHLEEVDQGDHEEDRDHYKVFPCDIIGACVLNYRQYSFLEGKINISSYFCL